MATVLPRRTIQTAAGRADSYLGQGWESASQKGWLLIRGLRRHTDIADVGRVCQVVGTVWQGSEAGTGSCEHLMGFGLKGVQWG